MANSLERLVRRVRNLEQEVRRARTPQLATSSIDDGAIEEYDADGNLVQIVGRQFDGTHVTASFNGPIPPQPTTPTVWPSVRSIRVEWDGRFANNALVPMDFSRVEVHVSQTPGFTADLADTLKGTIETPRGGGVTVSVDTYGTYYVVLVARSLSGKASVQSIQASGVPVKVEGGDLGDTAVTADHLLATNALIEALNVSDLSATNLHGANIAGGTIAIATVSAGTDLETFSGTALPSDWVHVKYASGLPTADGAVVGPAPAGSDNGVSMKIDLGDAGPGSQPLGSWTYGFVACGVAQHADAEVTTRFRYDKNPTDRLTGTKAEYVALMLRQTGTFAETGGTEDYVGLDLTHSKPRLVSVLDDQVTHLTDVELPTGLNALVAGQWYQARFRAVGGRLEAAVWADGSAETKQTIYQHDQNLNQGLPGVHYKVSRFLDASIGQNVHFDRIDIETLSTGFLVNPDGTARFGGARIIGGDFQTAESGPRVEVTGFTTPPEAGAQGVSQIRFKPDDTSEPGHVTMWGTAAGGFSGIMETAIPASGTRAVYSMGSAPSGSNPQHQVNGDFFADDSVSTPWVIASSKLTSQGTMDVSGAATIGGKLDVTGEITGGAGTTPYSSRYRSTNQTITDSTETRVAFGLPDAQQGNISWDNTNSVWTIAKPGVYTLTYNLAWATSTSGRREGRIFKNSTRVCKTVINGAQTTDLTLTATWTGLLAAGDTIGLRVWQNSSGNLALISGLDTCNAQIAYVGP